ncbi:MAG: hypothetical protein R3F34_12705 [Planctomycetota bacterium]
MVSGRTLAISTFLAVSTCVLATHGAWARDGDCPNEQASQVEAIFKNSNDAETCGLGIKILGYGGSIVGERCPRWEKIVPAHQVCRGEALHGHFCTKERDIAVRVRTCECGGLVIPFIETGLPVSCECSAWFDAGWVEDMETVLCDDAAEGPPQHGGGAG